MQRETRRAQPPVEGVEVDVADHRRRAEPDGELVAEGSRDGLRGDGTTLRLLQTNQLCTADSEVGRSGWTGEANEPPEVCDRRIHNPPSASP